MAVKADKIPRRIGLQKSVFQWRNIEPPLIPRLIALAFGVAIFAFLIGTVRVLVMAPEKISSRKASVIYLRDDAAGRAWTLRAKEGGPFPSRSKVSQWPGLAALESAAMEAARYRPPPYVAAVEALPRANELESLPLATAGTGFLPQHDPPAALPPELIPGMLAPMVYPLAGIPAEAIPTELPPFDAPILAEMAAISWRLLARLDATGRVVECVSLAKGSPDGATALERWLAQISFPPDPQAQSRWIAVRIAFINQSIDGNHPR